MLRRFAPLTFFLLLSVCAPVLAQQSEDPAGEYQAPAHISVVDGAAILEREGRSDPAPVSMPLVAGDRLRTQGGRVEVLFADGSALHLDANTVLDLQSDEVVRLIEGRVRLSIAGPASRDVSYRVDAPSAWVQIREPGEYRVAIVRGERTPELELAVLRGSAELINEDGRTDLRAGERAYARAGLAPSAPYVFNSAAWDSFDKWSEDRRSDRLGASAQYLPEDVRAYSSSFDRYGDWRYEQVYGYVWYPRVQVDWRPYYRGRWVSLRPYGWTWVGHDPWAWPTHHYGRWGYSAGVWFWIPGRSWGPAWVSWAYAGDYVSWCPLGWNNRPVINILNVNVFGSRRHYYDPWRAWTVLPRRHFGNTYVNVNVSVHNRIDSRTHAAFVVRNRAPEVVRYAVPRGTPIQSVGRRPFTNAAGTPALQERDRGAGGVAGSRTRPSEVDRSGARAFPAPAREPRSPGSVNTQRGMAPRADAPAGVRAVPRDRVPGASPNPSAEPNGIERRAPAASSPGMRRAVPRDAAPGVDAPARDARPMYRPERGVPSVRRPEAADTPNYERRSAQPRAPEMRAPESRPEYRAPSSDGGPGRRAPEYRAPQPPSGGGPERRAMPRGESPRPSGPAPGPSRGIERRGPSGSPPAQSAPPAGSRRRPGGLVE